MIKSELTSRQRMLAAAAQKQADAVDSNAVARGHAAIRLGGKGDSTEDPVPLSGNRGYHRICHHFVGPVRGHQIHLRMT